MEVEDFTAAGASTVEAVEDSTVVVDSTAAVDTGNRGLIWIRRSGDEDDERPAA
jgi:hypothetical protein